MDASQQKQSFWHSFSLVLFPLLVFFSLLILVGFSSLPEEISFLDFAVLSLATFRLIRLFVYDAVTSHIREYLDKFPAGPQRELGDLLSCPWCTGIWMAFFVAFAYFLTIWAWYPIFILALAGAATFIQITIIRIGKDL